MKKLMISRLLILFSVFCFSAVNAQKLQYKKGFAISADASFEETEMTISELQNTVVSLHSYNQQYEGKATLTGFSIKYPNRKPIVIEGTKLNDEAIAALQNLKKGDEVVLYDAVAKADKILLGAHIPMIITIK